MRPFDEPRAELDDTSILVTGGTGSFGNAFIKAVIREFRPSRLIVFSRDELKQSEMQSDPLFCKEPSLRFFLGDVRDVNRLESAMRDVDFVIHAAALKQVPAAEYNPFECIHTNVLGAQNIVQAAIRAKVKRVVALSTDKATNPINLYGASKLAADKIFVAGNNMAGSVGVRFSVVRYGNVLGSRGSVVQIFRNMLANGIREMPITDERMTRFWITLEQGVSLVLSSLALMRGGEIFVPKIPSTKLTTLVKAMDAKAFHKVVGIRPGEKVHEVLISEDDARSTVDLGDRYIVQPTYPQWEKTRMITDIGTPVPEGFNYSSNKNAEVIDARTLRTLLQSANV